MKHVVLIAILCLLVSGLQAQVTQDSVKGSHQTAIEEIVIGDQYLVKVGDTAPDFEMYMPDGTMMRLSELKGKVVMLQFTASWCGPCRKEMPHIESEIWAKHKDNPDFALYGIALKESAVTVMDFTQNVGVTYPVGRDPDASIFGLYAEETAGITKNIIIDRDGKIAMLTSSFNMDEFEEMVYFIDGLVAGKTRFEAQKHNTDSIAKQHRIKIDEIVIGDQYLVKVGDEAPDFEMYMPDGTMMRLSELKGKVVMLQFTASWCGPCSEGMPYIESEIWAKHKDNPDFALYGISLKESAVAVMDFIQEVGVTYPVGRDPDASIFKLYAEETAGITRNIIIGKDGKVAMLTRLFKKDEFEEMVDFIDELLEGTV